VCDYFIIEIFIMSESEKVSHTVTAIIPCNNLDASEAFYRRLGFVNDSDYDEYRMLSDGKGGHIHLTPAVEGWAVPGQNPFGIYFYCENVDEMAAPVHDIVLHMPEVKPWGMYEFALSDPDGVLVRVG
jgi:catechol 2,3-dioxygenase-like lactoylglutathione lyase family enzyme